MYRLKTSDITNSMIYSQLEEHPELKKKILKSNLTDLDMLLLVICREKITDKGYKTIETILTLGDELKIPMSQKFANLFYFTLNVNYNHYNNKFPMKITNIQHAYMLYTQYEGDFKKIDLKTEGNHVERFAKFKARHTLLFPEKNLYWEIPISFFSDNGKQQVCLASKSYATYAKCRIFNDGVMYKIPRDIFTLFFEGSFVQGKIVCNNTEEFKALFDETNEKAVKEVLNYCGLNKKYSLDAAENIDYYIEDGYLTGRILKMPNVFEEDEKWKKVNLNTYQFLRKVEYMPTRPKDGHIDIYMV